MKRPMIKEGGTSRIFDKIKTLETPLQSSGSCIWVPEAGTNLTTKTITKNGVYVAKDDDAYGYSSVTVNVETVGGITGTGSDGKQHTVYTDQSGNVVDSVAPVEIRITAGPNYTGPYGVGANISFDGLVVHAYDSSGADMGEVPFSELIFPETTAVYNPPPESSIEYDVTGLGINEPVNFGLVNVGDIFDLWTAPDTFVTAVTGTIYVYLQYYNDTVQDMVFLSKLPGCSFDTAREDGSVPRTISVSTEVNIDGEIIYRSGLYSAVDTIGWDQNWPVSATQPGTDWYNAAALALAKGKPITTNMDVPVNWARPGDGMVLSTSFGITVEQVMGGTL